MALFIPYRGELLCPSDWTIFEENMENPCPSLKKRHVHP